MFPSSNRVKLNRVALKDAIELKQAPRRRRVPASLKNVTADTVSDPVSVKVTACSSNEPIHTVFTDRVGPENVTGTAGHIPGEKPEEKCVGTQKTNKRQNDQTFKSNDRKEFTPDGPFTKGTFRPSKPNTRAKSRMDRLNLSFTWCFRTTSDTERTILKQTRVHCCVKPRRIISKMSCKTKFNKKALAKSYIEAKESQILSDPEFGLRKSFGKGKSTQRNIESKTQGPLVAGTDQGREGQSRLKAMCTGWDPQRATNTGQVAARTRSMHTGLSKIGRNTHSSPKGLACSKRSLRESVQASGCSLRGDCNYYSPRWKTSGKQGQNNTSPGPEQSTVEVKFKNKNTVTETSKKITVWTDQYPKVTLCDIAQKCNTFSPDCGYMLPDVLKTKAVHCFKQEMRAGFRFGHGCLGNNKHKNEEGALSKNRGFCPRVQPEMSICPSQCVTEHQGHLKEQTDVQTFSKQTTCFFHKSWTGEGSATSSASFLEGKCVKKGEWDPCMHERGVGKDPGPGSHLAGEDICTDKRIKLGFSGKNGVLLSTPHSESISCKKQENTDSDKGKKTCCRISDGSHFCSKHAVEGSSTSALAMTENCTKHHGETHSHTKPNATQVSPERFCERNQMDTDELESFTCQRVCVYIRKSHFSCARTYMSWPFFTKSSTLTAHVVTSACPAEPNVSSDQSYFAKDQNQPGLLRSQTNDMITGAPAGPPSDTTQQLTHPDEEKRKEDGESILAERNGRRHSNMSSFCSDSKNIEFAPHLLQDKEPPGSPPSSMATHSSPVQHVSGLGMKAGSASSLPVNELQTDSSFSTPSPSALGLTDWETATTLSSMPSPFTHGSLSIISDMTPSLPPASFLQRKVCCEDTQMSSCSSSPFAPPHNSDSSQSWKSSLLLPQDEKQSDEEPLTYSCPPELEPYYYTSPIKHDLERHLLNVHTGTCMETELMLPPVLSPVTSPERLSRTNLLSEHQDCSDEEEEELRKCTCKCKIIPGFYLPPIVNGDKEDSKDLPQCSIEELKGVSTNFKPFTTPREPQYSSSSDEDLDDGNNDESQDETDSADDVDQANKKSKQVPSNLKIKATLTSGDPCSSPSRDGDDFGAVSDEGLSTRDDGSSPSKTEDNERERTKAEAAGDTQQGILDEFTAYKQDILLVDVIQDDPELFGNLPQKSLLNLGPTRVSETPKTRPTAVVKTLSRVDGASLEFEQRLPAIDLSCYSPDITEESNRPWRPQCSSTPKKQSNTCFATESQTKNMGQPDANNNHGNGSLERNQLIQTVNSQHNQIPPHITMKNGPWITNTANMAELRHQKNNAYCRLYFSESLSCGFKMCRFKHVPVEGDEKFCIETVIRFTKNPMCLQKAGAIFTGYYQNNPPGVYFSKPVFLSLLWALLKAGMVSDVFSVLSISTAHKIVPGHEFVLALFNLVREKSLMGSVPELMHLTFKMANAGLVLSLDCLDCVKNTPEVQQTVNPNSLASVSGNSKLWTGEPSPECLNLAHVIVEIELCTKQEDWRRMGEIFRRTCQSSQRPNEVERISGRIAIALLSESKDKRSLPFAAFAETVCQSEDDDSLMKSFLGRIGVSLMLRYHKTHQWAKGRRVVEVLSVSKIKYSMLKGLFGNEDGASRCCLVTVATELLLLSGSVEGALNTLRENDWFLSSCAWPCEPADLESRIRVLVRLAEKTSHRDTLDVLCNLPGLKEPNESIDVSRYCPLFNSHLQVCVDRQTLPVASDTVDFMLSKSLAVDPALLQALLHKLGKQNFWLRAREVFRHSLSVGYYPGVSAPSGLMALIVPCQLREVELALAFEMFITVNATAILQLSETTTDSLSIVLKRTQSCESEYLSASSRLLSAACIPQPKLIIHYTKVNCSREQVFTLDFSSARCWLRHNHLWANEVWSHWT